MKTRETRHRDVFSRKSDRKYMCTRSRDTYAYKLHRTDPDRVQFTALQRSLKAKRFDNFSVLELLLIPCYQYADTKMMLRSENPFCEGRQIDVDSDRALILFCLA